MGKGWSLIGWVIVAVMTSFPAWSTEPDPEEVRRRMKLYIDQTEPKPKPKPAPKSHPKPTPKPKPKPKPVVDHDHEAWKSAEKCGTVACFRAYLKKHPQGQYAEMARAQLESEAEPAVVTPTPTARTRSSAEAPDLVQIPGGCFQMGSPESEFDRGSDEKQHRVCVKDFEIGKYEVTQAQWRAVMGNNPSHFPNCDQCPVEQVSWNDVQDYLARLNQKSGQNYRLPTESEWEYACLGGVAGQEYCGGDDPDRVAWHLGNSGFKTHPVGKKAANSYGLYDLSGNVREWTCSVYDKNYGGAEQECANKGISNPLAVRGGSWDFTPAWVRSAFRNGSTPANRDDSLLGFRLARSL